jgi:hypothetical protein
MKPGMLHSHDALTRMTPQHVGAAGATNTARHQSSAQALLAVTPYLYQFAAVATAALPGTNVDYEKVERFHTAAALIDARALAIAKAGGDRAAGLAAFAAKRWSPRREAFEELWVKGRTFIYFAANPGTAGATDYGDVCLVVRSNRVLDEDSAIFPFDTAQRYTDAAANVDAALAFDQVAVWESRADIAVIELATEAIRWPTDRWPELICGARYLEVVTAGPVDLGDVIALRVTPDVADELEQLWWAWRNKTLTDPVSVRKAKAYNAMMKWPNLQIDIV